ncbi:MAG: MBL fold metallo-hydrolase [Burkholderiaceae bacterium]|nr:MBL fold metallo-hydrolase [Burkholderiaceae bacterium]
MPALPRSIQLIERDWLSCNQVLLFDEAHDPGETAVTLIDSGYVKHAALTVSLVEHALARRALPRRALRTLINTHLHSDHCGGNAAIRENFGVRVLVPAGEFDAVRQWDESRLSYRASGQRCARFEADQSLAPGARLRMGGAEWDVLAAPGHDSNSLILHCPAHRILISADALWESGFGLIFPELEGGSGFAEQRAVLRLIATLDVRTVIPGHGPAFSDVAAALGRAHARLDALVADPRRNARSALRVLVKFILLDRESLDLAPLAAELSEATVMTSAARMVGMSLADALDWAAVELERQGQLRREGDTLFNREPELAGTD